MAVIVILAIILIIAVPMVLNVINTARYGVFGVSKTNIERAAELYYLGNSNKVNFDGNIAYIEIGQLKEKGYISKSIAKILDQEEISDEIKVLVYKRGRNIEYHLQMYDDNFLKWYQNEMIKEVKKEDNKPNNIGEKIQIELVNLMQDKKVSELRIPSDLKERCVGYVEIEKTESNKYEYKAYVDCLEEASTFASHYVSYGGKYIDEFNDVKETSDGGFIAVGSSNSEVITKYGTGNNGKYDAIIVKFDSEGNVEWSRNFGGSNDDLFNAVVEDLDGYVVVGRTSSNDFDIKDYKGGLSDAIIVKYNKQGEVVYKRSYGSSGAGEVSPEQFKMIIYDNNNYIVVGTVAGNGIDGDLEGVTGLVSRSDGIILKMDLEFNTIWRSFFVGTFGELFNNIIKTIDNNYIVVGSSASKDYDMEGLGFITTFFQPEAIILKYDNNGNLVKKKSFRGSKHEYFHDVIEVNDGYIAVGSSQSNNQDMEGLSKADNGYYDSIIVKYDKNLENIIWKKSFGGSDDDAFNSIVKVNDNEVIVVGSSKSNDQDMEELNNLDGYKKSIIIKYNKNNGNVVSKQSFGGSSSDIFSKITKTSNNKYIIAGSTYSNDGKLMKFNKGHGDAIVVKYDNNLKLEKSLIEPVVLIDVLKKIESSYGTSINIKYDNIYTSNDPTKDLLGWCDSRIPYLEENTSNYYYGVCLRPFNGDDMKLLVKKESNSGLIVHQGEYEYNLTIKPNNNYNWHRIWLNTFNAGNIEYSNLKLKFADGYIGHITDAINKGYIEPLVVVNSHVMTTHPPGLLPKVIDIINENGKTGIGRHPGMLIQLKPKRSKLSSVILTSSNNVLFADDGLLIYELRNFDMSITPTN